ncbi:MAG: discoidin domain-containing protein [Chloroflexaceae bacterium]
MVSARRPRLPVLFVLLWLIATSLPTLALPPERVAAASEVLLSQEKPTRASASQTTAPNANDGLFNIGSSWRADEGNWWQVDLEDSYAITRIDSIWLGYDVEATSCYQYTISVSDDGTTFTQVADRSDNETEFDTSDAFIPPVVGRYVRISMLSALTTYAYDDVTGCANEGFSSTQMGAIEFQVYGYVPEQPDLLRITDATGNDVSALALMTTAGPR